MIHVVVRSKKIRLLHSTIQSATIKSLYNESTHHQVARNIINNSLIDIPFHNFFPNYYFKKIVKMHVLPRYIIGIWSSDYRRFKLLQTIVSVWQSQKSSRISFGFLEMAKSERQTETNKLQPTIYFFKVSLFRTYS